MPNKRRRFTASQKAAIVLEALKEEKSIAQIAALRSTLLRYITLAPLITSCIPTIRRKLVYMEA